MTFLSRAVLTGVLMFFSAHAVSFVGEMISGNIVWKDASQTQESTVANRWINASPEWVTRWQPSVPSFTSQTLHLTQNGGSDSVSIPVEILGIQYNTPISGADPGFFPGAALISSGNTLKKNGTTKDGLFALNTVSYSRNQVPFTAIKPMISGLSSDALKLAFRGKQSGVYEGNIAFSLPMIYRRLTDEPVTYKGMTFTQTVRIVLRNATCTSAQWRKKQVVNLGDMTQRDIDNKTMNSTRVPLYIAV